MFPAGSQARREDGQSCGIWPGGARGRQTPLAVKKVPGCASEAMRFFLSGEYLIGFLSLKTLKDVGGETPTEVKMCLCKRKTGTREY